jgi:hypothetical protein
MKTAGPLFTLVGLLVNKETYGTLGGNLKLFSKGYY